MVFWWSRIIFWPRKRSQLTSPDKEIREVGKKSIKPDRKLEWKIRILVKVDVNKRQKCKDWKSKN